MKLLDASYLAPLNSVLFKLEYNKNSTEFKQYPILMFDKFKATIKSCIRGLVVTHQDRGDDVYQRYFWCAYDLTRKRRANHVQSWRKNKHPCDLIYGGMADFIATYGDPWAIAKKTAKKYRRKKRKRSLKFTSPQAVPDEAQRQKLKSADGTVQSSGVPNGSFEADPFEEEVFGMLLNPEEEELVSCVDCGNQMKKSDGYPRNSAEWTDTLTLRCAVCFETATRNVFIPTMEMNNNIMMQASKKTKKPCKCGAESHSTTRSKLCPLNAQYNRFVKDKEAVKKMVMAGAAARRAVTTTEDAGEDKQQPEAKKPKKPCKCGAKSHSTTRSKLCPLNAKYKQQHTADGKQQPTAAAATHHEEMAAVDDKQQPEEAAVTTHHEDAGTTTPPAYQQLFAMGDNVNAMWSRGKWFLGHVVGFDQDDGNYTVYFLCGKTKKLDASRIRSSDTTYPRRSEMIGKDFFFEGADDLGKGMWRVRQTLHDHNQYKCVRVTGDTDGCQRNVENFDVGYVIKQYMDTVQQHRESGIGEVFQKRTRGYNKGTPRPMS